MLDELGAGAEDAKSPKSKAEEEPWFAEGAAGAGAVVEEPHTSVESNNPGKVDWFC